jgi:hypothetical protein
MTNKTPTTETDNLPQVVSEHMEPTLPVSGNFAGQKRLVRDIGARMRQLAGLKPGSVSIRTEAMIAEIIDRLRSGETLLSITTDTHIAGHSTVHEWIDADPSLGEAINRAREVGAQLLFDARIDVALGGAFSTGNLARDDVVIKVLGDTAAKRNAAAFGNKLQVDQRVVNITLEKRESDW